VLKSFEKEIYDIARLLIHYSNEHHIMIPSLNCGSNKYSIIITEIINGNSEAVELLLDYSRNHNYELNFNNDNLINNNSVLAIYHDDEDKTIDKYKLKPGMFDMIQKYLKERKKCVKDFNLKDVIRALKDKNDDDIKEAIENIIANKTIMNINETDEDGNFVLLLCTQNNNCEILKLLIQYANENKSYHKYKS